MSEIIAERNDKYRKEILDDMTGICNAIERLRDKGAYSGEGLLRVRELGNCTLVITPGVCEKNHAILMLTLFEKIRDFTEFVDGDDPYKEHDFGKIEYNNNDYFFKFDYYDLNMQYRSENPEDENKTKTVLTIMLADEY